jgi:hypothetical protein
MSRDTHLWLLLRCRGGQSKWGKGLYYLEAIWILRDSFCDGEGRQLHIFVYLGDLACLNFSKMVVH